MFIFQMVFMEPPSTIVTGPPRRSAGGSPLSSLVVFMGAFTYPLYATLGVGLAAGDRTRRELRARPRLRRFRLAPALCLGRVSRPLTMAIIIGPRIGKFRRDGNPTRCGPEHHAGASSGFILAFGGSDLSHTGFALEPLRHAVPTASVLAVNTMWKV